MKKITPELKAELQKMMPQIDDELNIKIKKALRANGIEPTNPIIKRITGVDCKDNPLVRFFYFDYQKKTELKLLAFELKMLEKGKITTEATIFSNIKEEQLTD